MIKRDLIEICNDLSIYILDVNNMLVGNHAKVQGNHQEMEGASIQEHSYNLGKLSGLEIARDMISLLIESTPSSGNVWIANGTK